ncbi:MAG: hypothetical protein VYD90_12865 [Pseudomonadota bacterium]|nr:hypothetical protein [Pseudomonadota bacterium]
MNLVERVEVVNATIERFAGQPFEFGACDCGKMVIAHLKAMGWKVRTGGTWKSALGLKRWLRKNGGTGAACIDGWGIPRIPPAARIVGDIVELEGETDFGSFGIAVGNGRVLAFHEDVIGAAIIQPKGLPIKAAWRA